MTARHSLIDAAHRFVARGWSVLPVGIDKKPLVKSWKRYQTHRASVNELRDTLERPDATGLAVICGAISGGLVVRDFDDDRAYARWVTGNYALADRLPTVKTSRGHHVYARCDDLKTRTLADGELRGEGAYVVAPPSLHSTGWRYEWLARPFGEIPSVDVSELLSDGEGVSERSELLEHLEALVVGSDSSERSERSERSDTGAPDSIIQQTQPTRPGERNAMLMRLARGLKYDAGLKVRTLSDAKPFVLQWHTLALDVIETKPFTQSWSEFVDLWGRVTTSLSGGSVELAAARARAGELPDVASAYDDAGVRLLVGVCWHLARAGIEGRFYVSSHQAAQLVDVAQPTAFRHLKMLVADGLLVTTEQGNRHRANRYRWTGSLPPAPDERTRTNGTPTPGESFDDDGRANVRLVENA